MNKTYLLTAAVMLALPKPAFADEAAAADTAAPPAAPPTADAKPSFNTGVARARDLLDSAVSTSTLTEAEIDKLGARSLAEIFRNIPGMRAESTGGEGFANISIRGLPIAQGGSKFLQIQENGLPVLEFGDIAYATSDQFLRADLNLAGIQAIRGGSASTFASNSPGGIVNLIDKTGETEGGAVMATTGLDYSTYRVDFDYGAHLSDTVRFHVGGFYRKGEGPRNTGFDGYKGGQLKFNATKEFTGGYIRVYGKLLDDRTPPTTFTPVLVNGTNSDPEYRSIANFNVKRDDIRSRFNPGTIALNEQNVPEFAPLSDGSHSKIKSVGLEAKFDVGGWSFTEKLRYSDISGHVINPYFLSNTVAQLPIKSIDRATSLMAIFRATSIAYATGPDAGQTIASPGTLNGNGLLALINFQDVQIDSLNNFTNDLRTSKVFDLGSGDLTLTAGFYKSSQDIRMLQTFTNVISDVLGGGNAHLINLFAGTTPITQNGTLGYGGVVIGGSRHDRYITNYDVNAPYGSVNYHFGKIAIGGSLRYDFGSANGTLYGTSLPGVAKYITYDIDGNGVITAPETKVSALDYTRPGFLDYKYHYLSYSAGINYRAADRLSLFARYSKGARANADRILFANYVSPTTGKLRVPEAAYDPVKQAEAGVKYRTDTVGLFVTGFWAKTEEHNIQLDRSYKAYGVEFEGNVRRGIFSLTGGATWTKAEITRDAIVAATIGNTPKHQADLIFQATPQIETERFTVGANFYGTTSSHAADNDGLKMPGYVVTSAFVQFRPVEHLTLMVNANNLFNVFGIVEGNDGVIPANNVTSVRAINPRTISSSIRFDF